MKLSHVLSLSVLLALPAFMHAMEKADKETELGSGSGDESEELEFTDAGGEEASETPAAPPAAEPTRGLPGSGKPKKPGIFDRLAKKAKKPRGPVILKPGEKAAEAAAPAVASALKDAEAPLVIKKGMSYLKPALIGSGCALVVVLGWIIYQVVHHEHQEANDDPYEDDQESAQEEVA